MATTDYTATIRTNHTPEQAFAAISDPRGWWSETIEGTTDQLNAVFLYHYRDVHRCKMKVTELVPGKRLVWDVLDNYFSFTQDKSEWIGTQLIFDIDVKENKTEIRFTHAGLVPQYECYEVCREAWTNYITNSLRDLIETGKGQPNPEEGGYNEMLAEKWQLEQ